MRDAKLMLMLIMGGLVLTASTTMAGTLTVHPPRSPSLCTEDAGTGCVVSLPVGGTTMIVASDGERTFDPWGFGADTSDQVALDSLWVGGAGWTPCPGCTNPPFAGANIWVLPRCVSGVCENGNVPEPIGNWNAPGAIWDFTGVITWQLTESDGTVSDLIRIGNFGPGGDAGFTFNSAVPEPSSLLLLGSGLMCAAGVAQRRFLK